MTDPELLKSLDYILNRSDERSLDALAEAVVRRRRDITVFSAVGDMPNPAQMAKEITTKINDGVGGSIESMRKTVQDMIVKLLKEHAPELTDRQMNDLCQAWLPDRAGAGESTSSGAGGASLPPDVILSMVDQFVSFSTGEMKQSVDKGLRKEMGAWPERYWNAFPPVIRQIVTDYLKNKITAKDYKAQIKVALGI